MLQLKLKGGEALIKKLRNLPGMARTVLESTLNAQMFQLQSYIVSNFLSGTVLARRSGRLARSVQPIPATISGGNIRAGITAGGDVAFYGKFFEEPSVGGLGGIPHMWAINAVNARALQFLHNGNVIYRQYTFHPGLEARPFLRPALEQKMPEIRAALEEAIDELTAAEE